MHVVIGSGMIGSTTATMLAEAGEPVLVITRTGTGPAHPAIELVAADASDAPRLIQLSKDAQVIYNCVNPPYHAWPELWPPMHEAMLRAAENSGAILAITAPLYAYGKVDRPMTEDMPLAATTIKGRVRARMWEQALAAQQEGRVRGVTEIRGSDYISPKYSLMEMVLPTLKKADGPATVRLPLPLDLPHSYTYTGDVARLMITAAADQRGWGRAWHVPSPAPLTVREMVTLVAEVGGYPRPTVRRLPGVALRAAGLFDKWARAFVEMRYQFEIPFVLDSTAATETFGLRATDVREALRASLS
jgi:nucleoside-diphosphate-sugar epimerase